ncbi:MAG: restriction endonuclease subunit S, partial [candidate division WOR-3 bacterium]|nr:restriction endonuclease subunit S [candidate division WOR-3 bacterium]
RLPESMRLFYDASSHTTGISNLRVDDLLNLDMPLPSLPEQRRIAGILNEQMREVEKARMATEAQLEAARALPAAYLREVFESEEAKKWPWKPFGDLAENFDGRRVPVELEERRKGSYPYYGASGIIDYVENYLFDGEYLLIGEDGANLLLRSTPIAFRASGKFWVNNHAHVVQPREGIEMDWLLNFFAVTHLKPYVTGAAQPKMTQDAMNSIPVPVAPVERQKSIVASLSHRGSASSSVSAALDSRRDAIDKLPAALLRKAFSGEV